MCESHAYLIKEGKEELILESVDKLVPDGEEIIMENIFGQKKIIKAKIKEMALVDHRIMLESL